MVKVECVAIRDGEKKFDDIFSPFDTIPACAARAADRRTDRQTSYHSIVRAMETHRAVVT